MIHQTGYCQDHIPVKTCLIKIFMNFSIWGLLSSRLKEVTLSYPKSVYDSLYLENLSLSLILSQSKFLITLTTSS